VSLQDSEEKVKSIKFEYYYGKLSFISSISISFSLDLLHARVIGVKKNDEFEVDFEVLNP